MTPTSPPANGVGDDVASLFDETPLEQRFEIAEEMGSGQFATVKRIVERSSGRHFAANVIELFEVFETPTDVILILELVSGGELFDHVCRHEALEESEAAAFIRQILVGVRHLHEHHVVHMDIKPENILLRHRDEAHIKLIDFGLSRFIRPGENVREMVGTPEFVAPEVVNFEALSTATDMWALGVVTFIVLSGTSPFLGRNRDETFCNITAVKYHFSSSHFEKVSSDAKDFIGRLFVRDPRRRATVEECLRHPWIRDDSLDPMRRSSIICGAHIRSFKIRQRWRRAVSSVEFCVRIIRDERRRVLEAERRSVPVDTKLDSKEIIASSVLICCERGDLDTLEELSHRVNLSIRNSNGESGVHIAAGVGAEAVLHFLQRRGVPLDMVDSRGDLPLHWASRGSHSPTIRFIIKFSQIDFTNNNNETALHVASRYAQIESVLALLESGANVDAQDQNGETALHIAAWNGHSLLLGIICRFGPSLDMTNQSVVKATRRQRPPRRPFPTAPESLPFPFFLSFFLFHSSGSFDLRDLSLSLFLHSKILDPHDDQFDDAENGGGEFPFPDSVFIPTAELGTSDRSESGFGSGAMRESAEAVADSNPFHPMFGCRLLKGPVLPFEGAVPPLDFGGSAAARPSDVLSGLSASNPFRREAWGEERRFALTARGGGDPVELVSTPVEMIAEPLWPPAISSSAPMSSRRPTPCAVSYPSSAVFASLLNSAVEAGLPPPVGRFFVDGCFTDDETALHCASARGHLECVQSLLDSGCPPDIRDQMGQTALHLALRRSHVDIALLLVTKGCSVDLADDGGDTPLHVASRLGLVAAVQTLCHVGAAVDIPNSNSATPLHLAAKEGHLEVVRCLCLAGANVNITTADGQTPEAIAEANGNEQIVTLLVSMRSENLRQKSVEQLCPLESPLRRIKLKLFGHSGVGKSRLVAALQSGGMIDSLIDAVSRRFSDNWTATSKRVSDEGIHSCSSSTCSESGRFAVRRPVHSVYTHGIDVQNVAFPNCGEFSVWEFGGYEPYHVVYDHFVGNTDCVHLVVVRSSDPTEIQYKQVLYWMNFLKGRVTPSEPIGHCGIVSRRSKVIIVGTHSTPNTADGITNSEADALMKTIRLRFETHFDIFDRLILVDSTNAQCSELSALRKYLQTARESILSRLPKPLALLDECGDFLSALRRQHSTFPVITWPHFTQILRSDVNSLASDAHCRQLIQQLQLVGDVVYLRDESSELDYVVLSPEWLGTHLIGTLLCADFLSQCRPDGLYSSLQTVFAEISENERLLRMLDTLQLCAPTNDSNFEFPAFIISNPPKDIWTNNRGGDMVYGGVRVTPARGMERSLQSTFPRIQVALRRSMNDFQDPMDAELGQWLDCSRLLSGQMESLIRMNGDSVEILVRGPPSGASACVYFLEDVVNLVEQTASEVAPGISLERHFLSPKHLRDHRPQPASFPPEEIMAMQQRESLSIRNTDGEEEAFIDVVCFGSREVATVLTLGIDVAVSQLQLAARCELAALLDPPDTLGRDWSILAVKLNLADQLPEVDSTGQSLSRTDQLLAEWALQCPESASIGRLCAVLEDMGRSDARDVLYRTVPLYLFVDPLPEKTE